MVRVMLWDIAPLGTLACFWSAAFGWRSSDDFFDLQRFCDCTRKRCTTNLAERSQSRMYSTRLRGKNPSLKYERVVCKLRWSLVLVVVDEGERGDGADEGKAVKFRLNTERQIPALVPARGQRPL